HHRSVELAQVPGRSPRSIRPNALFKTIFILTARPIAFVRSVEHAVAIAARLDGLAGGHETLQALLFTAAAPLPLPRRDPYGGASGNGLGFLIRPPIPDGKTDGESGECNQQQLEAELRPPCASRTLETHLLHNATLIGTPP